MIKENKVNKTKFLLLLLSLAIIISVISSLCRFPKDVNSINFENSDATYHTLLTMQAYDETDVSIHHFLPIVTLGHESDKGIPWGATIPDNYGNYYYTSFSPFGYVLPYLFCKFFSLPISFTSLYLFNSILYFISIILIGLLLYNIFEKSQYRIHISILSALIYALTPEVLFSMGIVYWHQSLMQVFLIIQLLLFIRIIRSKKETSKRNIYLSIFFFFCLLNPYIEWTGYVANFGYVIALIILFRKKPLKGILLSFFIALLTLLSFMLFSLHYLSVVSKSDFFHALYNRFMARNTLSSSSFKNLIIGYGSSFISSFIIIFLLLIVLLIIYKGFSFYKNSLIIQNKLICFVALFPVLENFIMKQHATSYTYDRMKLAIFFAIVIADLLQMLFLMIKPIRIIKLTSVLICAVILFISVFSYKWSKDYKVWDIDYGKNNIEISNYLAKKYNSNNSLYALDKLSVRGYINLLFNRSVYEWTNLKTISKIANNKNCRYAVEIIASSKPWNVYEINYILTYDNQAKQYTRIYLNNGIVNEEVVVDEDIFD